MKVRKTLDELESMLEDGQPWTDTEQREFYRELIARFRWLETIMGPMQPEERAAKVPPHADPTLRVRR